MSDWLVELPEAGRSFRITEIEMAQVRDQCNGKTICVNPVRSLRVDGRELQGPIQGLLGITLRK